MLKHVRAWALALATLSLASVAHATCPNPSLTGLTGKDASLNPQTMATITQSGQQLPLHIDDAFNGTLYAPLTSDASCFLNVDIQAGSVSLTGTLPQFATPPTFNLGSLNGAAQDGTDASGVSPPTGGTGIRGWLSGIYNAVTHTLGISIASGQVASGAYVDCAITTLGCEADAAWSGTGNATLMAAIKKLDADVLTLNTSINSPIPANSKVGIDQTTPGSTNAVQPIAGTTGGATPYHLSGGTTASTNSTLIASGAHTLTTLSVENSTATVEYLRVYDTGTAPACSSSTGVTHVILIPANTSGAGVVLPLSVAGEAYVNGIGFCVTGGVADNDNTAAVAGILINASYK